MCSTSPSESERARGQPRAKSTSHRAVCAYHEEAFAVLDMIVAQGEEAEGRQETLKETGKQAQTDLSNSWHSL